MIHVHWSHSNILLCSVTSALPCQSQYFVYICQLPVFISWRLVMYNYHNVLRDFRRQVWRKVMLYSYLKHLQTVRCRRVLYIIFQGKSVSCGLQNMVSLILVHNDTSMKHSASCSHVIMFPWLGNTHLSGWVLCFLQA